MRRGGLRLRVPNPHGEDISVGLIAEILRRITINLDKELVKKA